MTRIALVVALLALAAAGNCYAAIAAVVMTADADTSANVTTDAVDTTGANLLLASASWFGTNPTISDSKSNTWTPLTDRTTASYHNRIYYCAGATVGSGHTFTAAGSGTFPSIVVLAVSGAHASPYTSQESGATGSGVSLAPGSLTPSENNCLVFTGVTTNIGTSHSANGGFTSQQNDNVGGASVGGGGAYLIQTTAAAANPTWSWTSSGSAAASSAVFKAAAAGGSTFKPRAIVVGALLRPQRLVGHVWTNVFALAN